MGFFKKLANYTRDFNSGNSSPEYWAEQARLAKEKKENAEIVREAIDSIKCCKNCHFLDWDYNRGFCCLENDFTFGFLHGDDKYKLYEKVCINFFEKSSRW